MVGVIKNAVGYNNLSPNQKKGITLVGGLLIAAGVVYAVYRIQKKTETRNSLEQAQAAGSELDKLLRTGKTKVSYNGSQFEGFSDTLRQAFNGCGTDELAIYRVFEQMRTYGDVLQLIATYGARKYDGCNWEGDFTDKEYSLTRALADEMDNTERAKINQILKDNGIVYTFA